ncbi:uncharacterized protein LOC62_01G001600 [Vanrija pseudolonga]|uniref:Uncharacterized protein n=1 Tax=Vanrija pseudolonga TaxID=143232 RepID=A0AAF0Y292_9TREE|nr:hypothetical protein LOC62_01G001600 [Vanrija pseudolonga]
MPPSYKPYGNPVPSYIPSEWTAGDRNEATFKYPIKPYWTQWHTASKAVGGVTERAYGVGDLVYEHGEYDDGTSHDMFWVVAAQDLEGYTLSVLIAQEQKVGLRYTLREEGGVTHFARETIYHKDSVYGAKARAEFGEASKVSVGNLEKQITGLLEKEYSSVPTFGASWQQ